MDNPCRHCEKMQPELFGCENPCQKAKDFHEAFGNRLDEILAKLKEQDFRIRIPKEVLGSDNR